ncbi:hypothetical protein HMPREF9056_00184 [Actinomyces sp. oral taxon 170 str. F0386]|nr:hypothetical protein HMPREF9056_00184 [Actinomyces sp. oral taxon 170 str. F0386]
MGPLPHCKGVVAAITSWSISLPPQAEAGLQRGFVSQFHQ